ncbi:hypothetical protein L6452_27643 [Arctium lappa]|uniref:Uncharacterized protein n=1 Tax=Arctium lappa TaxID=4217 RepID=A0ACB9A0W9_ARCLA|nr:hypothetical protein L6452_27643 [Arctium lappa]
MVELKCIKLSQQVSDFEKVIILEREKFAKEKKLIEQKNVGFFKEIYGQRKDAKKDFEEERNIFEAEIKKLTEKLSELSEIAQKDQNTKSEFEMKIDLLIKERDNYSSRIKELEDITSKVVVTEHTTPESQIHTPRDDSVDSECSFKTAVSSHKKTVSSKRSVKSYDQIRITNIFFDENVDGSDTYRRRRRRRRRYEEEKLVWRVKPIEDEKDDEKKEEKKSKTSCVHVTKAMKNNARKGKLDQVYSRDQLIRLSSKKYYCSYCRTHDHVHKTSDHYWYGSYSITPIRTATNKHGPKYQWVPKPKSESML